MTAVLALGPHDFEILPMSLQRIAERTVADWPAIRRFGARAARQFTGLGGEDEMTLEGLIFSAEFGGYEDYLALKATQAAGQPVPLVGWGAGAAYAVVFGLVAITEVGATHEYIGPDGIGRKIGFEVKVAPFGEDGPAGGLF